MPLVMCDELPNGCNTHKEQVLNMWWSYLKNIFHLLYLSNVLYGVWVLHETFIGNLPMWW